MYCVVMRVLFIKLWVFFGSVLVQSSVAVIWEADWRCDFYDKGIWFYLRGDVVWWREDRLGADWVEVVSFFMSVL